ncbi:hypothetical protein Trydic_g14460 [Trypoxylus dichotomus]
MILECILLLILSVLGIWLAYWCLRVWHFERYLKDIPHPPLLPLVGNALEFASSLSILSNVMKYHRKYNGNFKIYIGSQPFIFFSETKDIEFILNSSTILRKSDPYKFLHNWLGTGLLTSWGEKWKKHRKIITPAFHFQILEESIDVFNSAAAILIAKLEEQSKKGSIDVYPFIARCTLDIICETAMGTTVDAQNDPDSQYMDSVNVLLGVLMDRTFSPILQNEFLYRFSRTYQREREALKIVHGYSRSVINKKMEEFQRPKQKEESPVDNLGIKKRKAFLDSLLEHASKDPTFTFEDICQEVDTFMFEGHDTTATSISYVLFSLAANPEVQKMAYNEVQLIFADNPKRSVTLQDLQNMRYLEMVIKETLRVYTTIPFFGRTVELDTVINGIVIPKGTLINPLPFATHLSELSYKDPEKFDPLRFTPENTLRRNPFAFIPFSAGFRNCVGQKYAMLEMKSLLSNILRNFELLPAVPQHKLVLKSAAVLKSDNGGEAFAEQKEIFHADLKRVPTFNELKMMKYLEMVIKESLRIYTTIPVYARSLDKDVNWNGLLIPKGSVANISAYAMHCDPNLYPNPEMFDPQRFNIDRLKTNNPFTFVPFSAGPRNCVGQKFALLEMQCVLSFIIRSFEIRPAVPEHKIIFRTEAVLKSDNGMVVKLVKRN